MRRILKLVAIGLAAVVGVVAAFFGALVLGVILVVAALLALSGRKVRREARPGAARPGASRPGGPSSAAGDVIDIEARKIEATRELE
ncbi:hypothetical protein [Oleiharenicola sp. Vm1]|uniref:hypothetical protein n=1 Tax=Oleiharenicola sp. Vm1 TaxID=3398393 RepID=UPI0039F48E9A